MLWPAVCIYIYIYIAQGCDRYLVFTALLRHIVEVVEIFSHHHAVKKEGCFNLDGEAF